MQTAHTSQSESAAPAAVPRPTLIPSPDRRTHTAGLFGRNLTPSTLEWFSIEPDTSIHSHRTANLGEFREKPYRRWFQYLVDDEMSAHIDPTGELVAYGGGLTWHDTPSLGLVLVAEPSKYDPTTRPPNRVVGRMLKMALGTNADLDDLVTGPATWIGGYDTALNFYLPFTAPRREALFTLHRAASADIQRGSS